MMESLSRFWEKHHRIILWIGAGILILIAIPIVLVVGILCLGILEAIWLAITTPASVGDFSGNAYSDHATLSAYTGHETAIVLPATLEDQPVTSFWEFTDESGAVEEITIPDDLIIQEGHGFELTFPALQSYHVSDNHPTLMAIDGVLYSKDGRTLIAYPQGRAGEFIVPEGVETIHRGAFYHSAASSIVLPESLQTICYGAFTDLRLLRVVEIPAAVTLIEPQNFIRSGTDLPALQLIVTDGSAAHTYALENNIPIRQTLPAPEEAEAVPAA